VPGHDIRKINKAIGSNADTIVLDWEDGVPPQEKGNARSTVRHFFQTLTSRRHQEISLRINSFDSGTLLPTSSHHPRCG
jgi:citrate lyase subunit beta/citryl-CoA lyase